MATIPGAPEDFRLSLPEDTLVAMGSTIQGIMKTIHKVLTNRTGPYILFTNVSPQVMDSKAMREIRGVIKTYDEDCRQLIIKLRCAAHDVSTHRITRLIDRETENMGLDLDLTFNGTGTVQNRRFRKEADASWIPRKHLLPQDRSHQWPTIAVESGRSDGLTRLRCNAAIWITNFDCKVVIIISIARDEHKIRIEKWIPTKASSANLGPVRPVTAGDPIWIYENGTSVKVDNGPLVIAFEEVWLRLPDASKNEHNYIMSIEELQKLGREVWYNQELAKRQSNNREAV